MIVPISFKGILYHTINAYEVRKFRKKFFLWNVSLYLLISLWKKVDFFGYSNKQMHTQWLFLYLLRVLNMIQSLRMRSENLEKSFIIEMLFSILLISLWKKVYFLITILSKCIRSDCSYIAQWYSLSYNHCVWGLKI